MQERERLPINPESISVGTTKLTRALGVIRAKGRDEHEGEDFILIRNVGNLDQTKTMITETQASGVDVSKLVIGQGVNVEESCKKGRVIFYHDRLGIWLRCKQDPMVKSMSDFFSKLGGNHE
ncbi:MAG: hypothetical protein AAB609_03290 [Patescibacteria group bacterium]